MHEGALPIRFDQDELPELVQAMDIARGIGSYKVSGALTDSDVAYMQEEIFDPLKVAWRDNHDRFTNARGIEVIENHDVFALKLLQGDQRWVQRVPRMRQLANGVQQFVRGLSPHFPSLSTWQADEMSLHRYDDPEVGLSFHKDNLRFIGMIAVITLEGSGEFQVRADDGTIHGYQVNEGDLILSRATGLFEPRFDADGKLINECPEHAAMDMTSEHRTSFIVRDNSRPYDELHGFAYENWGQRPEA